MRRRAAKLRANALADDAIVGVIGAEPRPQARSDAGQAMIRVASRCARRIACLARGPDHFVPGERAAPGALRRIQHEHHSGAENGADDG